MTQITIDPEHIGAIIGPSGKIVRGIQTDTGVIIEIDEKDGQGIVTIVSVDEDSAKEAIKIIKGIVTVPEVGEDYEGTVRSLRSFGAIIEILPGKEGMLHVSDYHHEYVESIKDHVQVGDRVRVRVMEIRDDGKVRLSRKALLPRPDNYREHRGREQGNRGKDYKYRPRQGRKPYGRGKGSGKFSRGPGGRNR